VVVSAPPGLKDKIQNVINSIPGVHVNLEEVEGKVTAQARDCCKDGKIVKNGESYHEASLELSAKLFGITIWGPPTISKEFDFGVLIAQVDFQAGVVLEGDFKVGGVVGFRESDCIPESCPYGSVNAGAAIKTKLTLEAIGCVETFWTTKHCADIEITPAEITVGIEGSINYNTKEACNGFTGDVKLLNILFNATFKVGDVGINYQYQIYP
jgi:hypothetical protein